MSHSDSIMNQGPVKLRMLENPVCRIIYELFSIFGHISDTNLFSRMIIISFLSLTMSIGALSQIAKLIETNFRLVIFIDIAPAFMCLLICLIYLPIGYAFRGKYRTLLTLLEMNEVQKRTEEENKIKEKYDNYIVVVTTVISICIFLGVSVLLLWSLMPPILDFVIPLNESRPRELPFQGEYFIDQGKYFYEILFHQYINVLGVMAIAGSIEIIFLVCIIYTCGMFHTLGCKLENMAKEKDGVQHGWVCQDNETISRIAEFVEAHKIILRLIEILTVCCDKLLVLVLAGTLLIISITLMQVMNSDLITVKSVLMSICALGQFFMISIAGQLVINAGEKLFQDTYNSHWYRFSAKAQKLFILVIMKARRPCSILALNTISISFQTFSSVIQTGVSYAMVFTQLNE